MNAKFQTLDCDTDILMIEKDTFTVERFKELMRQKLAKNIQEESLKNNYYIPILSNLFSDCSIGAAQITVDKGKWTFPTEGIDCQILKIGSPGWQKGKLIIEASLTFKLQQQNVEVQINCEFCPDEPAEPESLFDDIRQSDEYKKLTSNN